MNHQPNEITSNPQPVSTIVKHIKIYSDNPIHDCIDRIINACIGMDEGGEDSHYHAVNLKDSAEELFLLSASKSSLQVRLHIAKMNEQQPN
jgi:hypothetical protein